VPEALGRGFKPTFFGKKTLKYRPLISEDPELAERVCYQANKKLALLSLYRYKEAFAFTLV
jgi:hypothetical protein